MSSRPGSGCSSRRGCGSLKTRSDSQERELTLARAKIGELLMMRLELAEHLIEGPWSSFADDGAGQWRHSRPTQYVGRRLRFMTARIRMLSGLIV